MARTGVLDAFSLLADVVDQVGVRTVRDTHLAVLDRVQEPLGRATGGLAHVPGGLHRGVASGVYAGLGLVCRTAARGLERVAGATPVTPAGPFLGSVVHGLTGDRFVGGRRSLELAAAVRVDGRDVPLDRLASAFPGAGPRLAVLVHGLAEHDGHWSRGSDAGRTTYDDTLGELGWSAVRVRIDTGLSLRAGGAAMAGLLQGVVERWPVEVEQLAVVGHSMGGLVARAAADVDVAAGSPWRERLTHLVSLGTPHLGAPLAAGVGRGSRLLAGLPETAALARVLDQRSPGVHDLVAGLGEEVPPLPHVRHHLVAASRGRLTAAWVGDGLVTEGSALGRRRGLDLFPGAERLVVERAHHFDLLNHPRVHAALRDWLGPPAA